MENDKPRFYPMDLDNEVNIPDVIKSAENDELIGVVDEKKGGIIAYALSQENANEIIEALKMLHNTK